jgi:hypothetical protein
MRRSNHVAGGIPAFALMIIVCLTPASGQRGSLGSSYYFVANTRPPDAFLVLRTHPSWQTGLRIMTMPNGTLLEVLERREDGWWHVRVVPTGQQGWALSGQGDSVWIECCRTGLNDPANTRTQRDPVGFRTPSNNIFCLLDEGLPGAIGYLRCDIRGISGATPPRPQSCDLDWGRAFAIEEDGRSGERICHGDTVLNDALRTLTYGRIWRRGGFTCKSEQGGLTCINRMGHGFSLSRNDQRIF